MLDSSSVEERPRQSQDLGLKSTPSPVALGQLAHCNEDCELQFGLDYEPKYNDRLYINIQFKMSLYLGLSLIHI